MGQIMKQCTLEKYKQEMNFLTKEECLEWMYQMSMQLYKIDEYVVSQMERIKKQPSATGINMLKRISRLLETYER